MRAKEFKEKLPKNESIVKTIISFSNTSGGKLIIGVSDAREAIGIEDENIFELQDKISSLIFDSCYPNILPEIYTLNLEGKLLLVIEVFRGNLLSYYLKFEILKNVQNFILNHINLRAEIKGLYRTDTYEIPIVALREVLINALIHRDYINQGRDIKVGVYDDIVNIVSPGSYPNSINQADIESGRSDARNRVIANVFKELGLIEQWGSGIARIKKSCLDIDEEIKKDMKWCYNLLSKDYGYRKLFRLDGNISIEDAMELMYYYLPLEDLSREYGTYPSIKEESKC